METTTTFSGLDHDFLTDSAQRTIPEDDLAQPGNHFVLHIEMDGVVVVADEGVLRPAVLAIRVDAALIDPDKLLEALGCLLERVGQGGSPVAGDILGF